jgi:hypothetical protein
MRRVTRGAWERRGGDRRAGRDSNPRPSGSKAERGVRSDAGCVSCVAACGERRGEAWCGSGSFRLQPSVMTPGVAGFQPVRGEPRVANGCCQISTSRSRTMFRKRVFPHPGRIVRSWASYLREGRFSQHPRVQRAPVDAKTADAQDDRKLGRLWAVASLQYPTRPVLSRRESPLRRLKSQRSTSATS